MTTMTASTAVFGATETEEATVTVGATATTIGTDAKTIAAEKVASVRAKVSTSESPVAAFKALFAEKHKTLTRSELIKAAVESGIAKNTAATYYQKLAAKAKVEAALSGKSE